MLFHTFCICQPQTLVGKLPVLLRSPSPHFLSRLPRWSSNQWGFFFSSSSLGRRQEKGFILKRSKFESLSDPNENLRSRPRPLNCTRRTFKGQPRVCSHGMAYEHDILKDALFVISHIWNDSVSVNVSRVRSCDPCQFGHVI